MLREKWMQELWAMGRCLPPEPKSTCGIPLIIIDQGTANRHAGPDFLNARIRMDSLLWVGCVEIHRRASDWIRHGHHLDPAYDNVILHVVAVDDRIIFNSRGVRIPALVLPVKDYPASLQDQYPLAAPPPQCRIASLAGDPAKWQGLLSMLARDAMEMKHAMVRSILARCAYDWERALLLLMASSFGLPANRLPFEWTLSGIPPGLLESHRDQLTVLEALLLGMAGFLERSKNDGAYKRTLQRHFLPFRARLLYPPLPSHLWKFLQMRPPSFPTLRLAQFAALIHLRHPLFHTLLEMESLVELESFLRTKASAYWDTHYHFGAPGLESIKSSGPSFIQTLIINGVAPFLYTYGKILSSPRHTDRAISFWQDLGPEDNHITRFWEKRNIVAMNALESQGLIHLYKYCIKQKHYLHCLLGIVKTDSLHE